MFQSTSFMRGCTSSLKQEHQAAVCKLKLNQTVLLDFQVILKLYDMSFLQRLLRSSKVRKNRGEIVTIKYVTRQTLRE